jgi:hypothetical protein
LKHFEALCMILQKAGSLPIAALCCELIRSVAVTAIPRHIRGMDKEIDKGLAAFIATLQGPFGQIPFERAVVRDLPLFLGLRRRGLLRYADRLRRPPWRYRQLSTNIPPGPLNAGRSLSWPCSVALYHAALAIHHYNLLNLLERFTKVVEHQRYHDVIFR